MNLVKTVSLFVDETGPSNPKSAQLGYYILCGCIINDRNRADLKILADQIKYKFWNRTDIVFHSREIWRKEGDFSILKNDKLNKEFHKHLFRFLATGGYQIFIVVVDHEKASRQNWNSRKVYKETSNEMVKNFILALLASGNRGRLVIESATSEKDFSFHKAVGHYLANGMKNLGISYTQVQKALTEVSFVTKKNLDIEEQIADLLAYGAKLMFLKKPKPELSNYDTKILKIVNHKLFNLSSAANPKRKKYPAKIENCKSLP